MKEKALRVLEYDKIKEKLKFYAVTLGGKELIDNLMPYTTTYEVENKLQESNEALDILIRTGAPPFEGLYDVRDGLVRAEKDGVLTTSQLLRIGSMLRCSRRFKDYISRSEDEIAYPKLEDLAYILTPIKPLELEIENAIVSEEEISDRASQTLYGIRKSLKEKNSSVREKINGIVRANAKYLQDSLYTMRGDRYVLPVKAEYKGAVPGLIHDQSSSGATLFIEPMSLVNLNNEIKELFLKEKAEIERILSALSAKVSDNIEECVNNSNILLELDFIFAKGKYASALNAICPQLSEDRSFDIIEGRHPLIDPKEVVPSDIYLGKEFNTIMIT
ncbi:MAG: endonuclease MutS2, partial [Clostridium sp.]